jgi:hypothetical protein
MGRGGEKAESGKLKAEMGWGRGEKAENGKQRVEMGRESLAEAQRAQRTLNEEPRT